MSSKGLFNRIKKLKVKNRNFKCDLEKIRLEQRKQEIFDRIHAVVEEHGGPENWEEEVEKILRAEGLKTFVNSVGIEFVLIPEGEFLMGSKERDREQPVHKVKIGNPFFLGKYPVTQKQWKTVMGNNPSRFKGDDRPVEKVSWNDVQAFIKRLNEIEGTDKYRLPSEAEWEYACRAGTGTRYYFGDDESELGAYAWYSGYAASDEWHKNLEIIRKEGSTHPVGQKKPNSWGLYDMHGNVWEWVQDRWHDTYKGAPFDGSVWEDGNSHSRVERSGSWRGHARGCRAAVRHEYGPDSRSDRVGFRLLRKR